MSSQDIARAIDDLIRKVDHWSPDQRAAYVGPALRDLRRLVVADHAPVYGDFEAGIRSLLPPFDVETHASQTLKDDARASRDVLAQSLARHVAKLIHEERERIAQAIEAVAATKSSKHDFSTGTNHGMVTAAGIARGRSA